MTKKQGFPRIKKLLMGGIVVMTSERTGYEIARQGVRWYICPVKLSANQSDGWVPKTYSCLREDFATMTAARDFILARITKRSNP